MTLKVLLPTVARHLASASWTQGRKKSGGGRIELERKKSVGLYRKGGVRLLPLRAIVWARPPSKGENKRGCTHPRSQGPMKEPPPDRGNHGGPATSLEVTKLIPQKALRKYGRRRKRGSSPGVRPSHAAKKEKKTSGEDVGTHIRTWCVWTDQSSSEGRMKKTGDVRQGNYPKRRG